MKNILHKKKIFYTKKNFLYKKNFLIKKFLIKKRFLIKKNFNQKKIISFRLNRFSLIEIFKTYILKKEFEKFLKKNLVKILKCGYCEKTACQSWHQKFLVSWKFCREAFCKACHNFNVGKETLLKGFDPIEKTILRILLKISFAYRVKLFRQTFK